MNKLLKYIVLACLIAPTVGYADLEKIYHKDYVFDPNSQTMYWIFFVARDYTPGHAFVVFGIRKPQKSKWELLEGYGKYPKKIEKAVIAAFGTIPGKIVKESTRSLRSANNGLAVAVSKKTFDYVLNNTEFIRKKSRKKPVSYNLIDKSCVDFTEIAARAVGLKIPKSSGLDNHPQRFIDKLKKLNAG